jgi:signal peptidase I
LSETQSNTAISADPEPETERQRETLPESISGIAAVFVSGLFILTFVIQQFEIPSRSMEKTLLVGDHVFVDRLTPTGKESWFTFFMPYREIHRGNIAVFPSPAQPGLYLVKRIIGVPGDRIHLRNGVVFLNGVAQNEPYVYRDYNYNPYADNFPSVRADNFSEVTDNWRREITRHIQGQDLVVPPGYYFAMGDHRDVSLDSRYWGFVPRQNILGSPLFIAWSLDQTEADFPQDASLADRLVAFAHTGAHFFSLTRWNRVLRLVH